MCEPIKVDGIKIRVYTDVNTYTMEATSNPVWVLLWVYDRGGHPVYEDKDALRWAIATAKWCDEECEIPDGVILDRYVDTGTNEASDGEE